MTAGQAGHFAKQNDRVAPLREREHSVWRASVRPDRGPHWSCAPARDERDR
jgi:hypothetical protein